MHSINPATGNLIKNYPVDSIIDIKQKLFKLQDNFNKWKSLPIVSRLQIISNTIDQLENNKAEYAYIITEEMGKVKKEAIKEVEKCILLCKYYLDNATDFLSPQYIETDATSSFITYEPLGVILGIMPWNFPFWQVFRFAVPTLLAGNLIVLKHANNVSGCALALESLFNAAAEDLNYDIYTAIFLENDQVKKVIANPIVKAVTLTGSVNAGKSVAKTAGAHLKKTVLELGGSDPYIVLANADIDNAVKACATGRLINAGQSCIAAKRLIVVAEVYDEFLDKLTQHFAQIKVGNPELDSTDMGPLASEQIFENLRNQVLATIEAGATCHFGGDKLSNCGYFFQPTILTNIPKNSPAYNEEIFGPVACVFKVANEAEALMLANDTDFGLGAAVFTQDIDHAWELATQNIHAGNVFINSYVVSDPRLPFGGIKNSGYGRELAEFGIHEFVNIKTVYIK